MITTIVDFLLSIIFLKDTFSYEKIVSLYRKELSVTRGQKYQKQNFLYLLPYKGYVRDVFWSIKFKNNKKATELLGTLLYETLPEHVLQWEQFEGFINPLILSVPSSKKRIYKRGFDHNELIITSFIKLGGDQFAEYNPHVLKKVKDTVRQSRTKSRKDRLSNQKGAFAVVNATAIQGRNIILFDDVLTTGATTKEIVNILKKAQVSQIKIVVIAH